MSMKIPDHIIQGLRKDMEENGATEEEIQKAIDDLPALGEKIKNIIQSRSSGPFKGPDGRTYHWGSHGMNFGETATAFKEITESEQINKKP